PFALPRTVGASDCHRTGKDSRHRGPTWVRMWGMNTSRPTRGVPVRRTLQHDLSVLSLFRGNERFVYVYDDTSRDALVEAIRAQAASAAIRLSWYDAAILAERVRRQARDAESEPKAPAKG